MSGEEIRAAEQERLANRAAEGGAPEATASGLEDGPERVPGRVWVTLVGFAVFVIAFGTCAANFLFN